MVGMNARQAFLRRHVGEGDRVYAQLGKSLGFLDTGINVP